MYWFLSLIMSSLWPLTGRHINTDNASFCSRLNLCQKCWSNSTDFNAFAPAVCQWMKNPSPAQHISKSPPIHFHLSRPIGPGPTIYLPTKHPVWSNPIQFATNIGFPFKRIVVSKQWPLIKKYIIGLSFCHVQQEYSREICNCATDE